jgi:hypothetical protein
MPRQFRAKNLSVSISPSSKLAGIADKLRLCVLHTHVCLGWSNCRLLTGYCTDWLSWCRVFTCGWGTHLNCDRQTFVACRIGTRGPDCGPGSIVADPGDILVDPAIYVRQIAELRADLQNALQELDDHEKQIGEITNRPQG